MKKNEKERNNSIVEKEWVKAEHELICQRGKKSRKLRTCNASVLESENYYFLRSYSTIVAFIDKRTDTCYDILRLVYVYTASSAQHIAKFRHDYGKGDFGCEHEMRWLK